MVEFADSRNPAASDRPAMQNTGTLTIRRNQVGDCALEAFLAEIAGGKQSFKVPMPKQGSALISLL